ncbi:hypothetical protein PHYPSEUDO_000748 [Phytophthora pseudosyringae]|uniref:Uncharacterized protein n=1 Tax=Phytophthora pseudosyringae TaxID=221518 RepID=A0A8T1WJY5_9STRA|nr:hypothetical protein PHYPSEUDO_000748 [Phytophthora pseudosyringae]
MDPRISTAPTPKRKKWVSNNTGASCLLRQPPNKSERDLRLAISPVVDRPQTCPTPTLTPQLHWNLNNSALKTLTSNQIGQLYGLYKFYDSSTIGDDLPSINCPRLVEILRDGRLLSESATNSLTTKRLQVEDVEKIFAQAVMGKMRVYLDADGQPALTFPLFCGALMNCAMLLTPLAHPEAALRQILPVLLEGSIVTGHHISATQGLLSHLPTDGSISLWVPEQSHSLHRLEDGQHDFRELPPFQQVIADCTRDKALEELKQEKLARRYHIPDHLVASFHQDTIAIISNKFHMFDVFDRGAVPRQEVFPLLSSLGKHADLPDPYAVLATLTANTESSSEASSDGVTLAQLLQVIETTRMSKRSSINAQFASMKVNVGRARPVVSAEPGDTPSVNKTEPTSSIREVETDNEGNTDHTLSPHRTASHSHGSSKDRGKRSRKSILSQDPAVDNSTHFQLNGKHHKATLTHYASVSSKKKAGFHRKASSKANIKQAGESNHRKSHGDSGVSGSGGHTQRSGTTLYSNCSSSEDDVIPDSLSSRNCGLINSDCTSQRSVSIRHLTAPCLEAHPQHLSDAMVAQVHHSPAVSTKTMIRIFLLLGGDHDGAIFCTISLASKTREITASEGIYYSTAPSETEGTTPVLPTQKTLMNALLMLKKCVLSKQEQGFELRPTNQLDAVDKMLQELERKQPPLSIAKSSVLKTLVSPETSSTDFRLKVFPTSPNESRKQLPTSQSAELAAPASATSMTQISAILSATPGQLCIPRNSPQRHQKEPPHSKPLHQHQIKLPSNYREIFAVWEIASSDAWVHALNAASPLKSTSPTRTHPKSVHVGHLSPLQT